MYKIIDETRVVYLPENAVITLPANESYGFAYMRWLAAGNTPQPVAAATKEQLHNKARQEAQAYLVTTDWYVVRQFERGVQTPEAVAAERARCVEVLNE